MPGLCLVELRNIFGLVLLITLNDLSPGLSDDSLRLDWLGESEIGLGLLNGLEHLFVLLSEVLHFEISLVLCLLVLSDLVAGAEIKLKVLLVVDLEILFDLELEVARLLRDVACLEGLEVARLLWNASTLERLNIAGVLRDMSGLER